MPRYKPGTIRNGPFAGMTYQEINFVTEYTKDFNVTRAAVVSGFEPEDGYKIRKKDIVAKGIEAVLASRLEASDIDAEWFLMECVENHFIAREKGQMSASNTALSMIAKHRDVDAFAADKLKIDTADEVVQRLKRARDRAGGKPNDEVSFF